MRRNPLRFLLVFGLLAMFIILTVGPGARLISRIMAAESAELSSYMPAIFNRAGGTQPTPVGTSTPTRPPKETETAVPTVDGTATATQTRTPTPEFTNTPVTFGTPGLTPQTPTSTPSPTAQSSQAIVLPNHSSYVDQGHDLHVVGEFKNTGATTIQFVNVRITFFTRSGVELADVRSYAAVTILPPGETSCFDIALPEPQGFSYYEFSDVEHLADAMPLPTLVVSNLLGQYDATHGFYNLVGKITNNGPEILEEVQAIGTLYDTDGVVRGCQKVPAGLDGESHNLPAGDVLPFQMAFTGRDNDDITSYRVQADGRYPDEEE